MADKKKKNKLTGNHLLRAIRQACSGLVFISETDAPIEPFFVAKTKANGSLPEALETAVAEFSRKNVDQESAAVFFDKVATVRDWHGEREKAEIERFLNLKILFYKNLEEVTLFRIGTIRIEVFVIGFDENGNVAGIATKAVET